MLLLLLLVVWATAAESSDCPARLAAAECELVRLRGPHGCPPGFTRLPTGCYRLLAEPCLAKLGKFVKECVRPTVRVAQTSSGAEVRFLQCV